MIRQRFIMLLLVIGVLMGGAYFMQNQNGSRTSQDKRALWPDYEVIEKNVDNTPLQLIVADTPERLQQGLMYVRTPVEGFDGMIFVFEDTAVRTFWNKNTFVDLKLYWMRDDVVVGVSDLPSIENSGTIVRVRSPEPADAVIEVIQ